MQFNLSKASQIEALDYVIAECELAVFRNALTLGLEPESLTYEWQPEVGNSYPENAKNELLSQLSRLKGLKERRQALG
jgi:hypothetical protein